MASKLKHIKEIIYRNIFTIRGRILLITVSFMLIFGMIASFAGYLYTSQSLLVSLIQTSETGMSFMTSSINDNISNVRVFLRSCQINNKVNNFLSDKSSSEILKLEAAETISDFYRANPSLQSQLVRLVILSASTKDILQIVEPVYSSSLVSSETVYRLPYFDSLRSHTGQCTAGIVNDTFLPESAIPVFPFVYTIQDKYSDEEIGYLYVELSTSMITQSIINYHTAQDSVIFFTLDKYHYYYDQTDQSFTLCEDEYTTVRDLSSKAVDPDTSVLVVRNKSDNTKYISITRPLNITGWYVAEYIDSSRLSLDVRQTFAIVMLIIIVSVTLLGFFLFLFLSRTIAAPVRQILRRLDRIKTGDFSRDPSIEWNHELGEVGKNINDLSEHVLSLMKQRIDDEKEKRDYEYRMLQSQINPHFLYNTLNSIKWMATINGATGIAEMTTSLSRLLKDISKGTTNLVTIEHELSLIKDYFTIQQYRYGGTITMSTEVENESLLQSRILKFTLQPIVENAIFHGIEPKGTAGNIRIHLYADDNNDIHIDITDDGVGMEPEFAATLLMDTDQQKKSASFFKEIGIANVHKRLQYEFGVKYGLSINSVKGQYTTVSVILPYNPKETDSESKKEGLSL